METEAATGIWSVLLPVIIGGALPLLGVALGPAVTQWLSERSTGQTTRVQRFEELLAVLHDHNYWVDTQRHINVFGNELDRSPPPLSKAIAIAALYFPDLIVPLKKLDTATDKYQVWMFAAAQRRLKGDIASLSDGFGDAHKEYADVFLKTVSSTTDYAVHKKGRV